MPAASVDALWLVWAIVAMGAAAVLLAVSALLVWAAGDRQRRELDRAHREWERQVLEYLCERDEEGRLGAAARIADVLSPGERVAFGAFVLAYLEEIRGIEAERLRELLNALRYEGEALRGLGARSPWTRALAAQSLGLLRSRNAVPALVLATHDRGELVSYGAAAALVRIGGRDSLSAVAGALGRRKDWNAVQIKELMLEGGVEFGENLLILLAGIDVHEPKAKVLVELIGMIRYLEAGPRLLAMLRSQPPLELRVSLLRSLGRIEFVDALPEALEALSDPDWVVRSQAATAVGWIGDETAVLELARSMFDVSYWVRFNAAIALGRLGDTGRAVLQEVARQPCPSAMLAQEVLLEGRAA